MNLWTSSERSDGGLFFVPRLAASSYALQRRAMVHSPHYLPNVKCPQHPHCSIRRPPDLPITFYPPIERRMLPCKIYKTLRRDVPGTLRQAQGLFFFERPDPILPVIRNSSSGAAGHKLTRSSGETYTRSAIQPFTPIPTPAIQVASSSKVRTSIPPNYIGGNPIWLNKVGSHI